MGNKGENELISATKGEEGESERAGGGSESGSERAAVPQ